MKKFFHSTIDYKFLLGFKKQLPIGEIYSNDPQIDTFRDLLKFIRKKSKIDLFNIPYSDDVPPDDVLLDGANPLLKEIIDFYFDGHNDNSVRLSNKNLCTTTPKDFVENGMRLKFIFFDDTKNTFLEKGNTTGYYFISSDESLLRWKDVIDRPKINSNLVKGIRTGSFNGWDDFNLFYHPLNAIIIVDNFLFAKKYFLENNLCKILKSLLPKSDLCIPIDIMIITMKLYEEKDQKEVSVNDLRDKIKSYIETELRLTQFRIAIIKTDTKIKETHDRMIYTNYFVIRSGHSFTMCGPDGLINEKLNTDWDFTPESMVKDNRPEQTNAEYYSNFLLHYKELIKKSVEHTECVTNRLLDI